MSKYAIKLSTLTAIGDAIRDRGGTKDKILVSEMPTKILEIKGEVLAPCEEVKF